MKKDWMRCYACGHGTDVKPKEPFIKIEISGGGEIPSNFVSIPVGRVELFACPKCGTIKIDI